MAACLFLLLLTVLQFYHLPTSLPPSSGTLLACSLDTSPCVPALVLNPVLFKYCIVLLCQVKNVVFIFWFVFMYYLYGKYYKPITLQYCIADCLSRVPGLTYKCALRMKFV